MHAKYDSQIRDAETSTAAVSRLYPSIPGGVSEAVVSELNAFGLVIIKDVLNDELLSGARRDAHSILMEGRMKPASADYESIRQDVVCFVRQTDGTPQAHCSEARHHATLGPHMLTCVSFLRGLTCRLEQFGYKRSFNHKVPTQCQLAYYPGNRRAVYVPHRDAASSRNFWQVGLLGWSVVALPPCIVSVVVMPFPVLGCGLRIIGSAPSLQFYI